MPIGENVEDMGTRKLGTYPPVNGTRFMIADYPPGNIPRMHRTETIDYIIVLEGEIEMELDGKETVTIRQGEILKPAPSRARAELLALPVELGESLRTIADPELKAVLESLARGVATATQPVSIGKIR